MSYSGLGATPRYAMSARANSVVRQPQITAVATVSQPMRSGKAYIPKTYLPKAYAPKAYLPKAYDVGPTNAFPQFRRRGFHSFQGMGVIDRQSESNRLVYVFSITAVRGLPSGSAPSVPGEIVRSLSRDFSSPQAGWAAGGRVWGKFVVPYGSPDHDDVKRRKKLKDALDRAASSLGRNVSFDVAGYGAIPQSSSAPAASTPPASTGSTVTSQPPMSSAVVKSTRDLQRLVDSKGFSPGSIDGRWGPATSGALNAAAAAAGVSGEGTVGSADGQSVSLNAAVWDAISALPNRRSAGHRSPPAPAPVSSEPLPGEKGSMAWVPWVAGGVALFGVGGYFLWKRKKR